MYQLLYVSSARPGLTTAEVDDILVESRRQNAASGLTGVLLYVDGNFIQVLEGEREDVIAAMERIKADPRHAGVIELLSRDITERDFPEWQMGHRRLDNVPEGSFVIPSHGIDGDMGDAEIRHLLNTFLRNCAPARFSPEAA